MREEYQKIIANILGTKCILYNPALAKALSSVKAGLFLSQLLYWNGKGNDPEWTYKTIGEMTEETALSRFEQENAIAICERYGVLEKKNKGIPRRRHFKVNIEKIIKLLEHQLPEINKPYCWNSTNSLAINQQTNTYNTSNITNKELSSSRKRPYFRGDEMRWSRDKWWVLPKDGGSWLEFAGSEKDIDYK